MVGDDKHEASQFKNIARLFPYPTAYDFEPNKANFDQTNSNREVFGSVFVSMQV